LKSTSNFNSAPLNARQTFSAPQAEKPKAHRVMFRYHHGVPVRRRKYVEKRNRGISF
jgi:hypothetical protein